MLSGEMKLELSAHKIPVMCLNNLLIGKLLNMFSNIPGKESLNTNLFLNI